MKNKAAKYANARIILLSEYLFVFLPFIVIAIVKIYSSQLDEFLKAPDWSFASSILFGQLLVKFVAGSIIREKVQWQRITLIISMIFVLGLVPSLVVLALMLIDNGQSQFLVVMQLTFFIIATVAYFLLGSTAQSMMEKD
jgi:hypothetical protein